MSLIRWVPSFLAFIVGGELAILIFGPLNNPLVAVAGGALVGAVIGGAQWLALGRTAGWQWFLATVLAVSIGSALSVTFVGSTMTLVAAAVTGLVTGALVGAAQGLMLRRGVRVAALWTATVALSWAAGWAVMSVVIVDLERGYYTFGASGAAVATIATGIALRILIGRRPNPRPKVPVAVAPVAELVR